jgi:hypothetical protein
MSTPDHAENTGDNLRWAAEQQAKEREGNQEELELPPEDSGFATPPLEAPRGAATSDD